MYPTKFILLLLAFVALSLGNDRVIIKVVDTSDGKVTHKYQYRDSLVYLKVFNSNGQVLSESGEKVNGTVQELFPTGEVRKSTSFKEGVPIGTSIEYYRNGGIKSKYKRIANALPNKKFEVIFKEYSNEKMTACEIELYAQSGLPLLKMNTVAGITIQYDSSGNKSKKVDLSKGTLTEYRNDCKYSLIALGEPLPKSKVVFFPTGDTSQVWSVDSTGDWYLEQAIGVTPPHSFKWLNKMKDVKKVWSKWVPLDSYIAHYGGNSSRYNRAFEAEYLDGTDCFVTNEYKFGGVSTFASFTFLNKELIKIVVQVPTDMGKSTFHALVEKYGIPVENQNSSSSDDILHSSKSLDFCNGTLKLKTNVSVLKGNNKYLVYEPTNLDSLYNQFVKARVKADLLSSRLISRHWQSCMQYQVL